MTKAVTNEMICAALGIQHVSVWFNFLRVCGSRPRVIGRVFNPATGSCAQGYSVADAVRWLKQRVVLTQPQADMLASIAQPVVRA